MLVLYSAYEGVAFKAINTAVESLDFITSLIGLFCPLKVPSPVCFVCCTAITASGKFCCAALPNLFPEWAGLETLTISLIYKPSVIGQ